MISQTAEYALRAVVCLAAANGVARTRQELSDDGSIPLDYLTRVMQKLSDHDIVSIAAAFARCAGRNILSLLTQLLRTAQTAATSCTSHF